MLFTSGRPRVQDFVGLWNVRKLPARLYVGVDGGSLRRTQHAWGRLAAAGASAGGSTANAFCQCHTGGADTPSSPCRRTTHRRTSATSAGNGTGGGGNVVRGMAAALEEEREAAEAAAMGRAVERRNWKAEQKDLLDEMLPAATAGTRWDDPDCGT